jgi:ComF family protein
MCSGALETANQCICDACVSELPWLEKQCQQCAVPLATDALCPDCQSKPPAFRRCISAFTYQAPIDNIILRFKKDPYAAEIKQLTALLAERILRSYQPTGKELEQKTALPELVIPMPLHWRKIAHRGFNQSQIIGNLLSNYFLYEYKTPLKVHSDICQRTSNSQAQHTLDKKQRARSVRDAFSVGAGSGFSLKGKTVAILDDVVTTGATANALASTVINAGADQVDIWSLARTGWNNCSH